jgi:hypothetical protein
LRGARIGGKGKHLSDVQRAMIRIMNDQHEPVWYIQQCFNCQRATVIANVYQIRKKKDDVSKDYETVKHCIDFVGTYPPEKGGNPVGVLSQEQKA